MQSSKFDNYKEIREVLPDNNRKNGICGNDIAKKEAKCFLEEYWRTLRCNAGRWMETNLFPLAIGGAGPTSMVFAEWICNKETIYLGEGMKYQEDRHECTIGLLRFSEFLDALTKGMKEEVWNDHVLDKHRKNIEGNIAEGMDIWNDPNQYVAALIRDVKLYIVIIKHNI